MALTPITPQAAQALLQQGAILIDIRSADEHARERIAQAQHIPMEQVSKASLATINTTAIIFHCRSGNRTKTNENVLCACAIGETYLLEGGLDNWKRSGLPVIKDTSQPLELQRQVQIGAGSIALIGTILGSTVSPLFYLLPGFVGAGLIFAGVSGFCGLARILMKMPWNKRSLPQL